MSAQTKEALTALEVLRSLALRANDDAAFAYVTVRKALEAAQQEAEAWEAIEEHRGRIRTSVTLSLGYYAAPRLAIFGRGGARLCDERGTTMLEALIQAAAWCRAELAK